VTEPRGRGVLDASLEPVIGLAEGETRWRGMTAVGDTSLRSRGTKCPSCWKRAALEIIRGRRECRMRVAPEAACAAKSTRVSNQGYTATAGIPCTMVLTVSFVLSSVTMLGCHRHQWNRFHQLSACIGAPGPHDFAVRTNAARRAMIALGDVRPSHPIPNVRDDREPPLLWKRDKWKEATDLGVRSIAAGRDRLARRANYAEQACTASHHRSSFRGNAPPTANLVWRFSG
jgi:hypothetical protein